MVYKFILCILLLSSPVMSQKVQEVVDKVWAHMGGMENYKAAQQLSFTFISTGEGRSKAVREHLWNRFSGDYVMKFENPDSSFTFAIYFNVNSRQGTGYKNGKAVSAQQNSELLDYAYRAFINDTYWLLVPAKLRDPGVHIQLEKQMSQISGNTVIRLSFDKVGLTPGDQYWLFIDDSGQIVRWTFILQSDRKGDYEWEPARDCGAGLRFSMRKKSTYGSFVVEFQNVEFSREIDDEKFRPDFKN